MDRSKLRDALESAILIAKGLPQFRARQLRNLVMGTPEDGLLYGIVLAKPVLSPNETPSGIEIWLNVSDRDRSYGTQSSGYSINSKNGSRMGGRRTLVAGARRFSTFSLSAGKFRVRLLGNKWTLPKGRFQPIPHTFATRYRSKPSSRLTVPDDVWIGSLSSNPVVIEIKAE